MGKNLFWLILVTTIIGGCSGGGDAADGKASAAAEKPAKYVNWDRYGNEPDEQRYSPLDQINSDNASRIGLAWAFDIPRARSLPGTPLAVDGSIYFSTDGGYQVFGVDALTGEQKWRWSAISETPDSLRLNMLANRGVAYEDGKVFVGVNDGRLVAIDAETGKTVWSTRTFPEGTPRFISGAPRTMDGKVIIGHGGADTSARGYVSTYDTKTGKLLWRWWVVPGNPDDGFENKAMEAAAKTWNGEWWKFGGGGTVWNAMTYDPELNHVYLGTGNAGGAYSQDIRSPGGGDNLYVASIVALDATTGEYKWHYQVNPGEVWDFKATMDMVITELEIKGKKRKVVMQAPTNGFFYVIDRETGELLSAEPWGGKVNWASHIDLKTGRPVENENMRPKVGHSPHVWPGTFGAHNYQPMSYNPDTGLVYIPHLEAGMIMGTISKEQYEEDYFRNKHPFFAQSGATFGGLLFDSENGGNGSLVAYDPVNQKEVWRDVTDSFWNGGTMTTAGNLVFYGTARGKFNAYNATTGEKVWEFNAGLGIISGPMTFAIDGTQYISLLVGYGTSAGSGIDKLRMGWKFNAQPRRLLTFKLDGKMPLPETAPPSFDVHPVKVADFQPDGKKVQEGLFLYHNTCITCHGAMLNAESVAPDLRESPLAANFDAFKAVLTQNLLAAGGMPNYADLTPEDIENLYHYVRFGAMTAGGEKMDMDMSECTFCGFAN